MKIVPSLIALIVLLSVAQCSRADIENWEFHHEQYATRYTTSGENVPHHAFGFTKNPADCSQDILYISWSTFNSGMHAYVGESAIITLNVDGIHFQQNVPLLAANERFDGGITLLTFTNARAHNELMRLLEEGDSLKLSISATNGLDSLSDDQPEHFSLVGLRDARANARALCAAAGGSVMPIAKWRGLFVISGDD